MANNNTRGQLQFNYSTFLQRGLNLWDLPDPAAARAALGITAGGLGLSTLTFGTGLVAGTYNPSAAATIAVDYSTAGGANKMVRYDGNGDIMANNILKLGGATTRATLSRDSTVDGTFTILNTGAGNMTVGNPSGLLILSSSTGITLTSTTGTTSVNQLTVASGSGSTTASINLIDSGKTTITRATGANGNFALTNIGTGTMTVSAGGAVSISTTGGGITLTSSSVGTTVDQLFIASGAGSTSAVLTFFDTAKSFIARATGANGAFQIYNGGTGGMSISNGAGGNITITTGSGSTVEIYNGNGTTTGGSIKLNVDGTVTMNGGATIPIGKTLALNGVNVSGNPSFIDGLSVLAAQTIATNGCTFSGNPKFSGTVTTYKGYYVAQDALMSGSDLAQFVSYSTSYNAAMLLQTGSSGQWVRLDKNVDNYFYVWNNSVTAYVRLASGGNTWLSSSDKNLKNIVKPITNACTKIDNIEPVVFTWKSDAENKEHLGFIAQNVKEQFPEVVDGDQNGMLSVAYSDLIPVCFAAIKELNKRIKDLENYIINN